MKQFKRAKVIMLPTTKAYLKGLYLKPILNQFNEIVLENHNNKIYDCEPQNLYIISDDELKEGDWCILNSDNKNRLIQCKSLINSSVWFDKGLEASLKYCKKIIATIDLLDRNYNLDRQLPQPSQQFITKYIEEYNKGNIITDILVEYEQGKSYSGNEGLIIKEWLKINSKDNTITIKKLKDSWNRDEVDKLVEESYWIGLHNGLEHNEPIDHDNWKLNNL